MEISGNLVSFVYINENSDCGQTFDLCKNLLLDNSAPVKTRKKKGIFSFFLKEKYETFVKTGYYELKERKPIKFKSNDFLIVDIRKS